MWTVCSEIATTTTTGSGTVVSSTRGDTYHQSMVPMAKPSSTSSASKTKKSKTSKTSSASSSSRSTAMTGSRPLILDATNLHRGDVAGHHGTVIMTPDNESYDDTLVWSHRFDNKKGQKKRYS